MSAGQNEPQLSVCVVTFNQLAYIEDCLQSIVDQNAGCNFEIIVGDDLSTDGSRDVLLEFQRRYPGIVRLILHESNVGALANYKLVHRAARGEFVAHVDGDDRAYPGKLCKQREYLLANPACALVAHRLQIFQGPKAVGFTKACGPTVTLQELLMTHPVFLNSSVMYRRGTVGPLFFQEREFIDFYLYVYSALSAPIGFICEVLGRYNANIGISKSLRLMPFIQDAIDLAATRAPSAIVSRARARQYWSYARTSLIAKNYPQFQYYKRAALSAHRSPLTAIAVNVCGAWPAALRNALIWAKNVKAVVGRVLR